MMDESKHTEDAELSRLEDYGLQNNSINNIENTNGADSNRDLAMRKASEFDDTTTLQTLEVRKNIPNVSVLH